MNDIKNIALLVMAITCAGLYLYAKNIQSEFDEYKGVVHGQLQKAISEKEFIERKYKADLDTARSKYADARRNLDNALERLRNTQAVPRDGTVQVAGCCSDSVPCTEANSGGAVVRLATFTGTCDADFYAEAMRQTLQCKSLIDYLK